MRILVFGTGDLGTLTDGLLISVHDVTLIARDPYTARMSATGFDIIGTGSAHVLPAATTIDMGHSTGLAFVAVKSFGITAAADALADYGMDTVLLPQSGLTEEILAPRLDASVLAGTATYGVRLVEPDRIRCTGVGRIVLGALDGEPDPLVERVGKAFCDAGPNTLVTTDMPRRRWEKLVVNAGTNAVTVLARVESGTLAGSDASELAHRTARETTHVARLERMPLPNRAAREAVDRVVEKTAASHSSMLQDVTAGKRTEVDTINGAVVDIAADHDSKAPTNRTLATLLRVWERGTRLQ